MNAKRVFPASVILALIVPMVAAFGADRPNVVLIMTDDQGYGDFGATGNSVIRTPNIDAMATRSASMNTFYVSPVCSPTRACLMTGRYNYRTRVIDTWLGRSMMEPDELTVAEALGGAGYATGIFGKWHLGDAYPMRPIDQGFEEALVHRGGGLAQPSEPRENDNRYTNPILFHNGRQVQTEGYCTDVYFDAAQKFIESAHTQGRSFFVYLPTNAPHGPYHDVPETLRKQYMKQPDALAGLIVDAPDDSKRLQQEVDRLARIAAMITNVDQNVGRLLLKLAELEIRDNTIVIFLVDNGPNTLRYAGPFRGMKSNVYEGGIRSPLWVHWPARLRAGISSDAPAAHIDLLPTILDACGVALPKDVKVDGRSFLSLLDGESSDSPDRPIVIQSHRGDQPVRYHHFMIREGSWKLLNHSGFGRESFQGEPQFELYNLATDPGEAENLIDKRPEIARQLRQKYDAWFDDVSSTRVDNYAPPRIHVGSPHESHTALTRQDWRGGTWSRDSVGYWQLHVERAGDYDIRLLFDPGRTAEQIQLTLGSIKHQSPVLQGQDSHSFRDVSLSEGDVELHAVLTSGRATRGVYQIEMSASHP